MAKRKKKNKDKSALFNFTERKKKKKRTAGQYRQALLTMLSVVVVSVIAVGLVYGFIYLNQYIKQIPIISERIAKLELINPPAWLNQQLKDKIYFAATSSEEDLKLDEDVVFSVQQNIENFFPWLNKVKVQATQTSLHIEGQWRKPIALIESQFGSFYLDNSFVVLDYIEGLELPIVKVTGLSDSAMPEAGTFWKKDDISAAMDILDVLYKMDERESPDKPLLYEIDRIDVSNFAGRRNRIAPHILLYAKDDTKIIWGAELGRWQRYLECPDEEKLAKLYVHYKSYGSVMNNVNYIDLSTPHNYVPQPIDKY